MATENSQGILALKLIPPRTAQGSDQKQGTCNNKANTEEPGQHKAGNKSIDINDCNSLNQKPMYHLKMTHQTNHYCIDITRS